MKITVDLDGTPQELRAFFGLPDVAPVQDELIQALREKMLAGLDAADLVKLMEPLVPEHLRSLEALQKHFWESFRKANPGSGG